MGTRVTDFGVDVALGNRFEYGKYRFGFLTSLSYDNEWLVSELYEGQDFRNNTDDSWSLVRGLTKLKQLNIQ